MTDWSQFKDLRPERHAPFHIPWLWLVAALAAAAAFWAWRRYRPHRTWVEPPKPAHVVAEIELDRLLREGLLDQGELDAFVTRLSGILRRYIENRFHLHAPERTTEEFYDDLKQSGALDQVWKNAIMEILRQSDLVKFAAEWIGRESAMEILNRIRTFVRETKAVEGNEKPEAKAA